MALTSHFCVVVMFRGEEGFELRLHNRMISLVSHTETAGN